MIIFDIETCPLPAEELEAIMPAFDESSVPGLVTGEFDPSAVKCGNLKDAAKIAAKIEEARVAHEAAKANAENLIAQARAKHVTDFVERAALHAHTGRVLVIGYYSPPNGKMVVDAGEAKEEDGFPCEEARLLARFWRRYRQCREQSRPLVGLNIHDFDLPFIVRRSWMLGIDVPATVIEQGRYWDRVFVDLRKHWLLGQHQSGTKSDFDTLAGAFGTPGKNGHSGADFARLWAEDRPAAIEYLTQDLKQPAAWAERMGLLV